MRLLLARSAAYTLTFLPLRSDRLRPSSVRTFLRSRILEGVISTSSSDSMYSSAISSVSSRGGLSRTFLSEPEARMLVSFFSLQGLTDHVVAAGVLGDDHPLIDLVARLDEHRSALLEIIEGEGDDLAAYQADHHAVGPAGDVALGGLIVVEVVVHDRLALRGAHQAVPQADQAAGGDQEFEVGVGSLHVHLGHLAAAGAGELDHGADMAVRNVDDQEFIGLADLAVDFAEDDLGLADGQLVSLAPHGFDQDGEVKQAAAGDDERSRGLRSVRLAGPRSI